MKDRENQGEARPFDDQRGQVPFVQFTPRALPPSKMFVIKRGLDHFRRNHPEVPVYDASQGDGGQSLPGLSPEELSDALMDFLPEAHATKYGTPDGAEKLREAVFRYHQMNASLDTTPRNVVMMDGGRDALQKWCQAVVAATCSRGGYVVTSAAPWITYLHGPYVGGLNILCAPGEAKNGFRITEEGIDACIDRAEHDGRPIVGLILTSPDNPTGVYYEEAELRHLIEHAVWRGIPHVFLDLIYQMVIETDLDVPRYEIGRLLRELSPAARRAVTVMDGLTKSIGASNVRSAHLLAGSHDFANMLRAIASHTILPNVLGEAVSSAFYGSDDPWRHPWRLRVTDATDRSRDVLRKRLRDLRYTFLAEQGYYAFINIEPWLGSGFRGQRSLVQIGNVEGLVVYLTEVCGVAVVPGDAFLQPNWIRFSIANDPDYTEAAIARLHEGLSALEKV